MCKSVPQIEAVFTRTSTSPCPTSGTGTLSIRNPRAASIFRSALIVAAIPASSSLLPQLINAQSQILAPFGVRRAQPPLSRTNPCHQSRILLRPQRRRSVIPTGATRLYPAHRTSARRVAEWRDHGNTSTRLASRSLPHYFFASLPLLLFISTFIPFIGFLLFNLAASTINFFSAGLFKSPTVRTFTCRTLFPVPSSNPPGSGSAAPRKKINVTCSFPVMKPHTVPFESNDGIFHGFTYSSHPAIAFLTSARKPFTTPFCFPAFSTYSSIHARPSFPSIVGIAHLPFSFRRHSNPFPRRPDFPASLAAPYNKDSTLRYARHHLLHRFFSPGRPRSSGLPRTSRRRHCTNPSHRLPNLRLLPDHRHPARHSPDARSPATRLRHGSRGTRHQHPIRRHSSLSPARRPYGGCPRSQAHRRARPFRVCRKRCPHLRRRLLQLLSACLSRASAFGPPPARHRRKHGRHWRNHVGNRARGLPAHRQSHFLGRHRYLQRARRRRTSRRSASAALGLCLRRPGSSWNIAGCRRARFPSAAYPCLAV